MTYATAHNKKKIQFNLGHPQYNGLFAFCNFVKSSADLSIGDFSKVVSPDLLDSNGYPNSTADANSGIRLDFFVPDPIAKPSAQYVCKWNGTGSPTLAFGYSVVSGSITPSGGIGRLVFTLTTPYNTQLTYAITSNISNFCVCLATQESAYDAGQYFNQDFLDQAANAGVIRFLDWMPGNGSTVIKWAHRKPLTALSWATDNRPVALYNAASPLARTGVTTQYTCTGPTGFTLADKSQFIVKIQDSYVPVNCTIPLTDTLAATAHNLSVGDRVYFNDETPGGGGTLPTGFSFGTQYWVVNVPDANHLKLSATNGGTAITGSVSASSGTISLNPVLTLNVTLPAGGTTGAIDLLGDFVGPMLRGFNTYPDASSGNALATIVYDSVIGKWIKTGGSPAVNAQGINQRVPIEVMLDLCAQVGAHPHFTLPHFALDPISDFVPSLMQFVKDFITSNGLTWMKPVFEPANEVWNTFSPFYQTHFAIARSAAYGWSDGLNNEYGKWVSTIGQVASQIWGGDRTKYDIACAVQTGGGTGVTNRLASTAYIGTTPQTSLTGAWGTTTFSATSGVAEAWRWATIGYCAQYFSPSDYGTAAETTKAAAFGGFAFTGSITGNVLTVTALTDAVNDVVTAGSTLRGISAADILIQSGTVIQAFGSGGTTGTGGLGTYQINKTYGTAVPSCDMMGAADWTQADAYANTTNSGSGQFNLANCKVIYASWKTFFSGFGIQKMRGYEGGYSPDFRGTSSVRRLQEGSKYSTALNALTVTNLDNFVGQSDGTFIAEFPSQYLLTGAVYAHEISYTWSALDDLYMNPQSPIMIGIKLWNARGVRLKINN